MTNQTLSYISSLMVRSQFIIKMQERKNRYKIENLKKRGYSIGDYSYGIPTVHDWREGTTLHIGRFCSISTNVHIFLGGYHRAEWITTYPFPAFKKQWDEAKDIIGHPWTKGDVIIGNDVWIGYGVTILSGVNVGDGAIISANAVVTKDVEPFSIVAGNPAQPIGKRFDDEVIERLQEIRWWDWPIDRIRKNIHLLCSSDYEGFFKEYEESQILDQ